MYTQPRHHGSVRGLDHVPRSPFFEGRFGRMFRALPPACFSQNALVALAARMTAEHEPLSDDPDPEENSGITAGYTYLGQLIDHDLSFDLASSLQKQNDPEALVDFRTPRFDLDCVYGRGPDDQPYLYAADGLRLLLGRRLTGSSDPNARDVPRLGPASGPRRAAIGDPRDDENVIVSQLHAAFLRFHNRVADVLGPGSDFETVQRFVRWHYQWVLVNDFLPTVVVEKTLHQVFPHLEHRGDPAKHPPRLKFFHWRRMPFMPVEFSVAAYRFGHSMVRPHYRLNRTLPSQFEIFASDIDKSLVGQREFPSGFAVDWSLFFKLAGAQNGAGKDRLQPAYKIDTSLVNPLGALPPEVAQDPSSLILRDLERGASMGLPSGQAVARRMGEDVIPDEHLLIGAATEEAAGENVPLTDVSPEFKDSAPLWVYVLAEAQQQFSKDSTPIRLGPVGGRIVAEVFAGLLLVDRHSFVAQQPNFQPFADFLVNKRFGIAELVGQSMLAKDTDATHTAEVTPESRVGAK